MTSSHDHPRTPIVNIAGERLEPGSPDGLLRTCTAVNRRPSHPPDRSIHARCLPQARRTARSALGLRLDPVEPRQLHSRRCSDLGTTPIVPTSRLFRREDTRAGWRG
jgi:hypothetical protein